MQRINIIGTSCAGKSTFAKRLAAALELPYIELDALHWNPGWIETPDEIMRQRVADAAAGDTWVIDGNYKQVRDEMWPRADTLIWLNYTFPLVFSRALRRTFTRLLTREPICNGNTESLKITFSRDSILYWVLTTHHRRQREFPPLLRDFKSPDKNILVFHSPREAEAWFTSLRNRRPQPPQKHGRPSTPMSAAPHP